MLTPRKTKYRKAFKGRIHGKAARGDTLAFGGYGLQSLEPERISSRQIEAARRAITRALNRVGKVWIRIFPDVPVTAKPAEVRMGSGKGSVDRWVCRVKPGTMLFEIEAPSLTVAQGALELAAAKLPVDTRVVHRNSRGE